MAHHKGDVDLPQIRQDHGRAGRTRAPGEFIACSRGATALPEAVRTVPGHDTHETPCRYPTDNSFTLTEIADFLGHDVTAIDGGGRPGHWAHFVQDEIGRRARHISVRDPVADGII
jgi:hypothetical protein